MGHLESYNLPPHPTPETLVSCRLEITAFLFYPTGIDNTRKLAAPHLFTWPGNLLHVFHYEC